MATGAPLRLVLLPRTPLPRYAPSSTWRTAQPPLWKERVQAAGKGGPGLEAVVGARTACPRRWVADDD